VPSDKRQRQREGRQARMDELRQAQQRANQRRRIAIFAVIAVAIIGLIYLTTRHSKSKKVATTAATSTVPGSTTATPAPPPVSVPVIAAPVGVGCPKFDGSAPHYTKFSAAPQYCLDPTKTYTVTFQTDAGTFAAVVDQKQAPKTANNFAFLAGYHYFDGIAFHRVIPGFVIQGGDPTGTGNGGPGYQFADELPKAGQYKIGSLAMANSGANTNGSQFFVITGDQGVALPPQYSLFGQVTTGMDVVKKIEADGSQGGTPVVVHKMIKVTVAVS
jgi:cyclophilin family peptidyl-prolyl cis-trans isomerase